MPSTSPTPPAGALARRTLLTTGGAVAAGLLAACGGSGTADAAGSAGSSGAATSSGKADGGSAPIVQLSAVPVGGAVAAKLAGMDVIVAQPTPGSVVAFNAACTHAGCPVKPAGAELDCPCHGSKFNALTGAVLNGPASAPLAKVAVKVERGAVVSA